MSGSVLKIQIGPKGTSLSVEKELKLVSDTDAILYSSCKSIDNFEGERVEINGIVTSMLKICTEKNGFGLSANQVGVNKRIFVLNLQDDLTNQYDRVYINPEILAVSETTTNMEEGCLSFPHLYLKINRPGWVILKWMDLNGITKQFTFHGLSARVILHEMDHLNGKTIMNHASSFEIRRAKDKQLKLMKKQQRKK